MSGDPHGAIRVLEGGAPLVRARLAVIALHGRGGGGADMLSLVGHLGLPDLAVRAPQAAGRSWWPQSFLAPLAANAPAYASALSAVARVAAGLAAEGFGPERTLVLGFSQGACLALEHAARAGGRHFAVVGLSGGLVGTGEAGGAGQAALHGHAPKRFDYGGDLAGLPVLIACHERDPHIPLARVRESAAVFAGLGAEVSQQIHPGAGHAVVEAEIRALRALLNR